MAQIAMAPANVSRSGLAFGGVARLGCARVPEPSMKALSSLALTSIVLALASQADAAQKYPSSRTINVRYHPNPDAYYSSAGCPPGQGKPALYLKTFTCELDSPSTSLPYDEWLSLTGQPIPEPGCWPYGTAPAPSIANTCEPSKDDPPSCKVGQSTSNARNDGSGLVGDPVDLTTGALSLDPVDVDLGHGLRFARHYSSTSTLQTAMGKSWGHGLDWRLFRATAGSFPVLLVKEPHRSGVAFVYSGTGSTYRTDLQSGGSLSLDGSGVAHYTSASGVEAEFDVQNRVVAIRHPGELPITVSYGADTATYTNGSQALTLSFYPAGHTNAGLVSAVSANGETWSYGYNGSQYLTSVVGPDHSTQSPSDTVIWSYVYTSSRITRVDRTTTAGTTTLGSWAFSQGRVTSADEPALEQALLFTHAVPEANRLQTTVKNASGQVLAVFDSTNGAVTSVSNTSGPAAPVAGGAGVPVPFAAATTLSPWNFLRNTETDQNGNVTLFENYDDHGRPQTIVEGWVDGTGAPGVFSVDDSWSRWREYSYHPVLGEPLTVSEDSVLSGASDRVTIFDYDDPLAPGDNPAVPNENPTARLHARTEQGSTLDAGGAVVAVSATTRFAYDEDGRVTSETGPRPENYTEHSYDSSGNRTATRRYLNGPGSSYLETAFSDFDARGNPQTVTDPNGRITTFTYDTAGRVKTVTPPYAGGGSTITSTYDVDGNLVRVDFPNDSFGQPYFLRMGYDAKNRLEFFADSAGNATVYERTGGRVTREALYAGFVDLANRGTLAGDATFSYDAAGRLLKAFNPLFADGSVYSQYSHDGNGNQTGVSDENGKLDNLLYDALNRLTTVEQVRGGTTYTTGYVYDAHGNVRQVTDPAGKATDYQFDDLGRLVKVTSPNTGVTLYLYDLAGNLVAKKEDFAGTPRTTLYEYDGLDRLARVDFPSDADSVFSYDASAALNQKGRLSSVGNGVVTTELEYTDRGEIAVERMLIGGGSYAVSYGYDAAGNLASIQTPSGVTAAYAYSAGRPKTVTVTAGGSQETIRNLAFLPFGPRTWAEFPPYDAGSGQNTVISTRSYNLRGQVSALAVTSPLGAVLDQSFTYGYVGGSPGPVDAGPNLDQVIDNRDASESRFYFYDDLDRLWKSTSLSGTPLFTYAYDANGNRTQQLAPGGTTSYSYDSASDRIAQATGAGAKHYAHDNYGNRIWAGPTPNAGSPSHVYDQGNRLVEVRDPVTQAVLGQYTYDAAGRRVRKVAGGVTTFFFYDSAGHLVESQNLSTSPATRRSYVLLEDEPVGLVDQPPSGSPVFSWIHTDRLGTPLAVTSTPSAGSAKVIWRATYEPFGLATADEDPDGDGHAFGLDLRFPGQLYDPENGQHDNLHRTYDATIGRYLEPDPLGQSGSRNLFRYADDNPAARVDPRGLQTLTTCDAHPELCTGAEAIPKPPPAIPVPPIVPPFFMDPEVDVGESDEPVPTAEDLERRNKLCLAQWYEDTAWCDRNTCGEENIACHDRANDNLRRCYSGQPRLPRVP
jgi:RHS repeat-associated protein